MNAATAIPARSADSRPRTRQPVLDQVCAEAVDLALAAAEDVAGIGEVGRHVGVVAEGDRVVTHLFECKERGYRGWNWAVTLTRAPRTKFVTLDETVLVAGGDSVLAPDWVPWSERLQPGDLGPGDLLPIAEDDARLVPAYTGQDEQQPDAYRELRRDTLPLVGYEMGLGRPRVLSREGREDAAERWHEGDFGPHSPMAQAAPARCSGCGFLAPLAGMLGQAFGVCTNEIAPSDGRVVSLDYGCGAHSEAAVVPTAGPTSEPVVDEYVYDTVSFGERVVTAGAEGAAGGESADAARAAVEAGVEGTGQAAADAGAEPAGPEAAMAAGADAGAGPEGEAGASAAANAPVTAGSEDAAANADVASGDAGSEPGTSAESADPRAADVTSGDAGSEPGTSAESADPRAADVTSGDAGSEPVASTEPLGAEAAMAADVEVGEVAGLLAEAVAATEAVVHSESVVPAEPAGIREPAAYVAGVEVVEVSADAVAVAEAVLQEVPVDES